MKINKILDLFENKDFVNFAKMQATKDNPYNFSYKLIETIAKQLGNSSKKEKQIIEKKFFFRINTPSHNFTNPNISRVLQVWKIYCRKNPPISSPSIYSTVKASTKESEQTHPDAVLKASEQISSPLGKRKQINPEENERAAKKARPEVKDKATTKDFKFTPFSWKDWSKQQEVSGCSNGPCEAHTFNSADLEEDGLIANEDLITSF